MLGIGNGRQPQLDNTERNHQGLDNAFVFLDTTGSVSRGHSILGIEPCYGGNDCQRPGATGERNVEFLAGKGRRIENDGVIEFEALDEERRADETAAAHGPAPVTKLRVVVPSIYSSARTKLD